MADVSPHATAAETGSRPVHALEAAPAGDASARERAFARFYDARPAASPRRGWNYTDLRALMRDAAPLAQAPGLRRRASPSQRPAGSTALEAGAVTLVNGHFVREPRTSRALPEGVEVIRSRRLSRSHPLLTRMGPCRRRADNAALRAESRVHDGRRRDHTSPRGTTVERPIHLRFVNAGEAPFATATRVLVVAEVGATLTLVESHEGPDGHRLQTNGVVEIVAGDHARVRHVRLNREGAEALALSTLTGERSGRTSRSRSLNVVPRRGVSRHQVFLAFMGEHSTAQIIGGRPC
jgi:Fe-S cluster assembly protein SufD